MTHVDLFNPRFTSPLDVLVKNFFDKEAIFDKPSRTSVTHPIDVYEDENGLNLLFGFLAGGGGVLPTLSTDFFRLVRLRLFLCGVDGFCMRGNGIGSGPILTLVLLLEIGWLLKVV